MLTHHTLSSLAVLGLSTVLLGCATSGNGGAMDSTSSTTAAASASQTQGWRNLIDPTLSAWRGYREATAVIEQRIHELFDELERADR